MTKKSKGFSLFEMVISICIIAILYAVAVQRLNELPASAERVSFYGVLSQVKTGVSFEMIRRITTGEKNQLESLSGSNPMDFLLETPSNYLGEVRRLDEDNAKEGSWYFELDSSELVYVIGSTNLGRVSVRRNEKVESSSQIRFKLLNVYRQSADNVSEGQVWDALLVLPVYPFEWVEQLLDESDIQAVDK